MILFRSEQITAQSDLPKLPADTVLEDPASSDFSDDIFFDDFETNTTSATDTTTDTADTTTANEAATVATTTVADTATGADTSIVFGLAAVMALITLFIFKNVRQKYE